MTATATLVTLALGTYVLKAVGPVVLGGRTLPGWLQRITALAPAALLAALVAAGTLTTDGDWALDARVVGVAAAALALWRRAPFVVVVVVAGGATALVRLVGS